jgi:hypothetical protein
MSLITRLTTWLRSLFTKKPPPPGPTTQDGPGPWKPK